MLIAPNILKAVRVDRSDQSLALLDLRWVKEEDKREMNVNVGEIIEWDAGGRTEAAD